MRKRPVLAAAAAISLCAASGDALAGSKIFSSGSSMTFSGSVETNSNQNRDPFVAQIFAPGANTCIGAAVTVQGADLEATLISPSGRVWQDDDGNGSLRPRINARSDVRGWYVLVLSHFSGAVTNADFTATLTRGGTCVPTTNPVVLLAPARKAAGAVNAGPSGGAN